FVLASNAEVKLLPTREMVVELVKISIVVGVFICLIIGADSFSGERDRSTLEGLLLSPASRGQVALGKLLAATSPWPVALVIAIPMWIQLAETPKMLGQAMVWGPLLGTLLAPAMAGMGMLVSIWCNSNRTSMLVSLCLFLVLLLPTELMGGPAKIQRSAEQWTRAEMSVIINPVAAPLRFLWKTMANGLPAADLWYWHTAPILFTVALLAFLFWYAGPRLRLEPAMARRVRSFWDRLRPARVVPAQPLVSAAPAEIAPIPEPRVEPRVTGGKPRVNAPPMGPVSGTWWLVFKKELGDLWIGGKAMWLCLILAIVLGGYSYIMARDSVLSLVPPEEMVYELLKAAMVGAVFVGLILGADALSGERERATLEALLVTPVSRRQMVVGKFLAALSPWPVGVVIAIPYLKVLSQGNDVFGPAVFWGAVWGALLAPAFTALGMFISFWCNSNKTSLFVSLCSYLLFLLPTQLPGRAQGGFMGTLLQWVNPMAAERVFLSKVLTNNKGLMDTYGPGAMWTWGVSTVVFAVVIMALLFWFASPGLRLEGGRALRLVSSQVRAVAALLVAALLAFGAAPALAQDQPPAQAATALVTTPSLDVGIDLGATTVRAGTPVLYKTTLTNTAATPTSPLIVAMNIINLNAKGEIVDPEDWSPQRTQYTDPIAPGQSVTHDWRVNAILDGNYMVYMVVIPPPHDAATTSHPVSSPAIHLTVTPYTRLNPGGVMPFAIGGPVLLILVIFFVYRHRRKQIDAGGS
ncbi:MAG TPA: ABC transporter permease subunit, partial [Gemmatimonadales bacterium]|nr:ABC transporter permease subunit [Gemmatimonadales bacterium]